MRRIRLLHVNLVLFVAVLVLALVYRAELKWAWVALPGYLGGETSVLVEVTLELDGQERLKVGDLEGARERFEQSIAIEPHSTAVFGLGEVYRRQGNLNDALLQYVRYQRIDPTFLPVYFRIAEIYETQGKTVELRRILGQGADYFREHVEAYVPRIDDTVEEPFNFKAEALYDRYRESLRLLEAELERTDPGFYL